MPRMAIAQTAAGASVDDALSHFDRAEMARADKLIDDAIAAGKCPGAVLLVGRGDGILYEKAYGNRALKPAAIKMTDDTIFDLASLTKSVATAPSIMLLSERGKLKLDDPVAKYLPAFAANGKGGITIADLLLHIGGLTPDNDIAEFSDGPKIAMQRTLAIAPTWKPRSRFAYSDVGYIVLGELVHAVDGRPLNVFARDEIFRPLGMSDTGYLPPESLKARCAPTEQRNGHWMIGEVHDPRAYALGGVAGHAGVFSTAEDLSRFCRMILDGGKVGRVRIFKPSTVARWIKPRELPGGDHRTYGFDVDTPYAGIRGERFEKGITFGHTGFTGTAFWLDPINHCYFILLTHSVHPDGKGNILALRYNVATAVANALLGPAGTPNGKDILAIAPPNRNTGTGGPRVASTQKTAAENRAPESSAPENPAPQAVLCGIDVLEQSDFKPLAGRKIGLITNHTGRDRDGRRTIDLFASAKNLQLVRLFSPEHGIDGVFDEKVNNATDAKIGLKIFSLYGPTKKPTPEMLQGIDTLVFDIQDVGVRFYTYSTTLGLCMQAAAEQHIRFLVLDRPNPNTGLLVDGPLADAAHLGFTAFGPLPLVHGMTVGELARFYNGELKLGCDLQVVPMTGWRRRMWWDQTGLMWINPSPNLRSTAAALLYPAVGLLESSNISMGRGTDQPFERLGAPWMDGRKLASALNAERLPGLRFVPITFEPAASKFAKQKCQGVYIEVIDRNAFAPARAGVAIAWQVKRLFGDKFESASVGSMLQNAAATAALQAAKKPSDVPREWKNEIDDFRKTREKYLIYQ
ncbi:MAG TPA: exo-beta-N-acetylmuramidase NamZ domain-containing protein [Tepidisphaeraceae bacterium]|nr:exo-beta-N-acetylmuramidase NamZ domain-containing protein [Tepidisphaeraceae bacterium]